jgi:hypothetical protein
MPETDRTLAMYLHLARASQMRQQPMVRDKLLVLAGVQAQEMGLESVADDCRQMILAHNGRHLVRQWPDFEGALSDERFQMYLKQLKRRYSPEKIEHMLASLGIEMGSERATYFTDLEYATALLDAVPQHAARPAQRAPVAGSRQDESHSPARQRLRLLDLLVVWGPFALGLALLAVAALVARAGWQL